MAKIKNRKRLKRKLLAIPKPVKLAMQKQLEQGANELNNLQRVLVPKDTQLLLESINWVYGEAPKGTLSTGQKKDPNAGSQQIKDTKISIFAGDEEAYYARWVEFGTIKTPAQPYFYPPFRIMRKRLRASVMNAARGAIRKIAKEQQGGG